MMRPTDEKLLFSFMKKLRCSGRRDMIAVAKYTRDRDIGTRTIRGRLGLNAPSSGDNLTTSAIETMASRSGPFS